MSSARPAVGAPNSALAVCPDPRTGCILARGLAAHGYVVRMCTSVEQALLILLREKVGIVLVDLATPALDPAGFLKELQKRIPGVRVYALAGPGSTVTAAQCRDLGFVAAFVKPIPVEALCQALDREEGRVNRT